MIEKMAKYRLKRDTKNQFYWVLWSDKNNRAVAMSSESYVSKQSAQHSIEWTRVNAKDAELSDET